MEHLHENFERFGPISVRKMSRGWGIHDGLMFAPFADDDLYLKADAENVRHFEEAGLAPFEYPKAGRLVKMSYYRAPDEILEDREQAAIWVRLTFEAALCAAASKRKPGR